MHESAHSSIKFAYSRNGSMEQETIDSMQLQFDLLPQHSLLDIKGVFGSYVMITRLCRDFAPPLLQ